jgi:hypothetical protein
MTKVELANTIANARANADPAAITGPNGLQLCCAPLDQPPFNDITVVLHDRFLTASFDGDSDTIDLSRPGADNEAAALILSLAGL